ncbi:MAG: lactate utilization protein B [Desulfatibacillaceae bacterium]
MKPETEKYLDTAREQMKDAHARGLLEIFPVFLAALRDAAYQSFPEPGAAHDYGGIIRAEAVARMPELLEQFEENARAAGSKVFWARDAAEANRYVVDLAKKAGAEYVCKGKSMVTEEIGLNEALEEQGIHAYETDLGEFITQIMHRPPFHIVGPAINIPPARIRDEFLKHGVLEEPTEDPVKLGHAARLYLRDRFHHMVLGVTGVNMAVARTGTVINVENEGNIRFSKSSPRVQVSIMTLEKVVPTMEDAMFLLRTLCRSATGQHLGAYVSMDTGPKKDSELDGPEELHVIILDNGRTRIYADPEYREALQCVRCGACLNFCPIYRKIGGYPYGWAYSGPMGQVLSPLLLGLDKTRDLYQACTMCRTCKVVCPGGISHPALLRKHRTKNREKDATFSGAGLGAAGEARFRTFALAAAHPGAWRSMVRLGRAALNRGEHDGVVSSVLGKSGGWFEKRDLPALARPTFNQWYRMKKGKNT